MGRILKEVSKISGVYGQPGEERVSLILAEKLSDDYVILNSPRIYYHGATYDIDHIVIGPNGVFLIETKNMQGTILGGMMGNWIQEKKKTGKNRRVKIGNPANQVNQYGKTVKSYLGSRLAYETGNKTNIRVYPVVVFVHDGIDLSRMDYTKPGYIGRVRILGIDEITDYIEKREGAEYSPEEVSRFAEFIVPVDQRDQTGYYSLERLQESDKGDHGRYELFEELGRGNFGVVYRGFDYRLDTEVAVKKLLVQNRSVPDAVSRFHREARIASGLRHKNIVGVQDYFENLGEFHIVMELIEGVTLEEYMKENFITIDEALKIFKEIATGIQYAHENGVVHRDLKPSNILMTHDGQVKISDFGIAKLVHTTDLTLEGMGAGTPISMSPEQITGAEVTQSSDIFALGSLLYFLLTGKMPFDGNHLGEIVQKVVHHNPEPPGQANDKVSADLDRIVLKALEKKPEDRFSTSAVFLQAVDGLLDGGKLSVHSWSSRWFKFIPGFIRPIIKSERRLFTFVTLVSLIIFISIMGIQGYRDSRQVSREAVLTKQYGFTNENLQMLYENPKLFIGMPVKIVGRIDKLLKINNVSTQFSVAVKVNGQQQEKTMVISYNKPHFNMEFASFIEISGSLQNIVDTVNKGQSPLVIADKVEPIEDPWSILAPSQYTIYPNLTVDQSGKVVQLEKVEFAEQETRLFVKVRNESSADDIIVLANPVAIQAGSEKKEVPNVYGMISPPAVQLLPEQEARTVIFLEPLDRRKSSASFALGSTNDILMGQEAYVFDVSW